MARSSDVDPIERFRFKILILTIDLSALGAAQTLAALVNTTGASSNTKNTINKTLGVFARLGFSEITIPKVNIGEIPYRENIDAQRFAKIPGLVKYEPVYFRRGVISSNSPVNFSNQDLYNWYSSVNDESILSSMATELVKGAKKAPAQSPNFRHEVLIQAMDREGNTAKQWLLFNAWPISYKGGNDLNSSAEDKLVEELGLTYEYFLEFEANILEDVAKAALEGAINVAITALPALASSTGLASPSDIWR